MTYIQKTLDTLLLNCGFVVKNEVLIPWAEKEDFQQVLDFVDLETGDVFSFTITEGTTEAFACCSKTLDAYNNNLLISVE
ncbi:hypothetical protein lotta81_gp014 [Flavobacterium phage vB_FspM_lotta8-1]|uniref:Uncharacterized protein n=1 Tax=Flavobacterium phage vB_FspM_lotta8-1 TaxID=2686242 RepID=A0A6B9L8W1_9CAUD|nr:hypothetical protein HWC85_gp14 [Flavobacterium phage vB_FspM_lotta8-1]QHB38472.1 hypothetical protein lotta81_gp014 [Flavobacterium phage vB_FspM_lotta8-1]